MNIGDRIKIKRLELGLTQTELGKRLGISKSGVCKAESSINDMTTDRIAKFANALECTPAYLMGWEDVDWNPETQDIYISNSPLEEIRFMNLSDTSLHELLKYAKYLKMQEGDDN